VNDHPRSEKVPPALFKMGVVTAEAGDLPKARGYLRRVIEEYSTSDEAKLAKNKLAEIR
jgi:TolA-binding protein